MSEKPMRREALIEKIRELFREHDKDEWLTDALDVIGLENEEVNLDDAEPQAGVGHDDRRVTIELDFTGDYDDCPLLVVVAASVARHSCTLVRWLDSGPAGHPVGTFRGEREDVQRLLDDLYNGTAEELSVYEVKPTVLKAQGLA